MLKIGLTIHLYLMDTSLKVDFRNVLRKSQNVPVKRNTLKKRLFTNAISLKLLLLLFWRKKSKYEILQENLAMKAFTIKSKQTYYGTFEKQNLQNSSNIWNRTR